MNTSGLWAIGIDVGGTKIEGARVASTGKAGLRIQKATEAQKGPEAVKKIILSVVKALRKSEDGPPCGVGIGMAGEIDPQTGSIRFWPNFGWKDVPFREDLARNLSIPVAVFNDVRAITWGEWKFGAGRECEDLICLYVGTGIGGGVISGGRLLSGSGNSAGEFGHITVSMGNRRCSCGNRGCLQALAGGRAIAEQAQEAVQGDPAAGAVLLQMAGGQVEGITARTVIQACKAGDGMAGTIMGRAAEALSAGLASLVNAFNPRRCILGGGVIEGMRELIPQVECRVRKMALPPAVENLQILPAQLGNDAGVVGAASLAMHFRQGV
jgi:glucokinase